MDFGTLKYFETAARVQHMTKAAEQLNITQPTLSAGIRRLEAELGFQLFDRTGRGIQLNEYGRIFLKGVEAAERAINASLGEMAQLRQGESGFVRIACAISPTNSHLIDMMLDKGLSLKVSEVPDDWERQLLDNECDLVITFGRPKGSGVESALLRYQKLGIAASKNHPLAGREHVSAQEINEYPFCSTSAPPFNNKYGLKSSARLRNSAAHNVFGQKFGRHDKSHSLRHAAGANGRAQSAGER